MIYTILIILLTILSATFSASEMAFSTVNKMRLKNYAEQGNKKAEKTLKVANDFDKALTAILIGNNIVNIASTAIGTVLFTMLFGKSGPLIATIVMTIVVLVCAEILPKSVAKENAEKFALFLTPFIATVIIILKPFIAIFTKLKTLVSKIYSNKEEVTSYSEDELKYLIDEVKGQGVLEEGESELVRNALDFDEITLAKILIPRVKVIAVPIDTPVEKAKDIFFTEGYSRLPVFEDTIDNIVGYISLKDFVKHIERDNISGLEEITKKILRFSEFMTISEALKKMQEVKVHIAVVIDQHSGTKGIVTLEDIIEELVGDVYDENDELIMDFAQMGDNIFEISGEYPIDDFSEHFSLKIETESNTLAGWVMELFGYLPEMDETVNFENLNITVLDVHSRQIKALRIVKKEV
ncbi:MAG: hemolysin family protein [Oscillospiraceae bacterium]|jgi:CBS domain containing-hemolysin-like protein|nr:hemolysin family protein [Oscillospiraceae bacterium]